MDRLFLDPNVLFLAAYRPDARHWKLKRVVLCSSRHAIEEARINLPHQEQQARLITFSGLIYRFEAGSGPLPRGISLLEKDAPILLAAIAADATHLLSGDVPHFGPHFGKTIGGIAILPPGDYLRLRARET